MPQSPQIVPVSLYTFPPSIAATMEADSSRFGISPGTGQARQCYQQVPVFFFDKALGAQFDKLIYRPLRKVNILAGHCPILILVVDVLDECEKEVDIKTTF
ncbi:uncharacterized protein Z519_12308 [Cladophialophora bantiana CBS 173.52]|uniref:Uncharacterized protein n=1 Tax=Cladophialophora bantiana (strain ATCC 10958 / CBS 173.52 / CDC B-1940 / NIH 8579) TaxID=1442370 RepID=A0A0D2EAB6_CLAB1|nr:uncharacterized protein Z519_12308 [Cladophialophora bantiana CBS 173.52]KIW87011.1 hypothetical protein Z519_12308 [Cladophialophora bantiana CBS 173.52]